MVITRLTELASLIDSGEATLDWFWIKTDVSRKDPGLSVNKGTCIEFVTKIEITAKGLYEPEHPEGPAARPDVIDTEVVSDEPASSGSSSGDGNSGGISDSSSPGNDTPNKPPLERIQEKIKQYRSTKTAPEVDHPNEGSDPPGDLVQHNNVAAVPLPESLPGLRIVIKKGSLPDLKTDIELILVNVQELPDGCKGVASQPEFIPSDLTWIYKLPYKGDHAELQRCGIKVRNIELVPIMRVKNRAILQNSKDVSH